MKNPDEGILGQTRRPVAIAFIICLAIVFLGVFPAISTFYDQNPSTKHLFEFVAFALGLMVTIGELRHSGEANEYRKTIAAANEKANEYRDKLVDANEKANNYRKENNELQDQKVKLVSQNVNLQNDIEKRLTRVRLFARVHLKDTGLVQLFVSNLSEFDLWITTVEVIVTEAEHGKPDKRQIGGGRRLSKGKTEDGFDVYGALVGINGNRTDSLQMKFYVEVTVQGVNKDPVTEKSPPYSYALNPAKLEAHW